MNRIENWQKGWFQLSFYVAAEDRYISAEGSLSQFGSPGEQLSPEDEIQQLESTVLSLNQQLSDFGEIVSQLQSELRGANQRIESLDAQLMMKIGENRQLLAQLDRERQTAEENRIQLESRIRELELELADMALATVTIPERPQTVSSSTDEASSGSGSADKYGAEQEEFSPPMEPPSIQAPVTNPSLFVPTGESVSTPARDEEEAVVLNPGPSSPRLTNSEEPDLENESEDAVDKPVSTRRLRRRRGPRR